MNYKSDWQCLNARSLSIRSSMSLLSSPLRSKTKLLLSYYWHASPLSPCTLRVLLRTYVQQSYFFLKFAKRSPPPCSKMRFYDLWRWSTKMRGKQIRGERRKPMRFPLNEPVASYRHMANTNGKTSIRIIPGTVSRNTHRANDGFHVGMTSHRRHVIPFILSSSP